MKGMRTIGTGSLLSACACLLLFACSDSHGPSAGTSGSNWLKCERLRDCRAAEQAAACSTEGFCVDGRGERIAKEDGRGQPEPEMKGDAGARDGGPVAAPGGPCLWGTDELLAHIGATVEERTNCGRYPTFDTKGVLGGYECFGDTAVVGDGSVEVSINTCFDCYLLLTYVYTPARGLIEIRRERDSFGGDDIAEVSVQSCQGLSVGDGEYPPLVCVTLEPMELYRCSEPASNVPEEEPQLPVDPLKLGDVSAEGEVALETLHLYVSNQSFEQPLVRIEVEIDGQHVVTGDFAVGSQHNWVEFTIEVPSGSHDVRIWSPDGDTDLDRTLDMAGEQWAVIDYWTESPKAPFFTFNVHDAPVSFD